MSDQDVGKTGAHLQRRHVSDAAWNTLLRELAKEGANMCQRAMYEELHARRGVVLLTVAEVEKLERAASGWQNDAQKYAQDTSHWHGVACERERERDALRAELAANDAEIANLVDELRWAKSAVQNRNEMIERLRKGKDDGKLAADSGMAARNIVGSVLRMVSADPLDHRLGLPPADAEPCEPMSGRVPYRWGMM